MPALRLGVIGHVEHITLGLVSAIPTAGEITHLTAPQIFAGGGGGVAFFQLARSAAELHLFTALGDDEGARVVEQAIAGTRATLHVARRAAPQTRDVVMVDPTGERTIVVVGEPLHPRADDPLRWELLAELDAVYFTAQDPALLVLARRAHTLVVSARRKACIAAARVAIDVIVGSSLDRREATTLIDHAPAPGAVVMTAGAAGGTVERRAGIARFATPHVAAAQGSYGAGDSFAAALTYYLATGLDPVQAATRAAPHGAAVAASTAPLTAQLPLPHAAAPAA